MRNGDQKRGYDDLYIMQYNQNLEVHTYSCHQLKYQNLLYDQSRNEQYLRSAYLLSLKSSRK
jgi:hypothetical protein